MRAILVIVLSACLLLPSLCRPQRMDYNNESNEEEEDDSEPAAEDTLADDEDTRLEDQEAAVQEDEAQFSRSAEGRYLQRDAAEDRPTRTDADNFPDYRPTNRDASLDDQLRMPLKTRQTGKYMDANDAGDQQEAAQHLTNRDVNKATRQQNQRENQNLINKRTIELNGSLKEEGDMLFQNNKEHRSNVNKNEYNNNEASDSSEQSRYFKQYYNTMQAENRGMADDKNHEGAHYNLRDRRDTKESNEDDALNGQSHKDNEDKTGEDEESAIKRHIKKLSGDELEQLLNSLSEDKRELLKKIINDNDMEGNALVNKREITKKSEAIEDNNFVETAQSDLSKVQGSSSVEVNSESSATQNTDTTEASKQTADSRTNSNDISSSKTAELNNESDNKAELTEGNDEGIHKKSDANTFSSNLDSKNQAEIVPNIQVTSKTNNKRETNMGDLENMKLSSDDTAFLNSDSNLKDSQDYSNDEGYFCSDEHLSQFLDDEARYQNEDSKTYKRETDLEKQSNLADSMKSLEESFPNAKAYGASGPYSGPLVRVKRKNSNVIIKKRSAALEPDAKVAYVPYKAENEDEDDEGNEFDDEGFYDRTSNFENGNKALEDDTSENSEKFKQPQRADPEESKSSNDNPKSDTMSLGSDTDNVLSGVEGVDDNIMYSSGSRNIRTAEDTIKNENKLSKFMHPTSLIGDLMKTPSENFINVPHYQENDAFGPLPKSYEGDLGRYKRIRRVKQTRNSDDPTSDMSE